MKHEGGSSTTNIDEFLGVREGKFIANGGHDRLLACIGIYVSMWNIRVSTVTPPPSPKVGLRKGNDGVSGEKLSQSPLEGIVSAEVELLPPKMDDIAVSEKQKVKKKKGDRGAAGAVAPLVM